MDICIRPKHSLEEEEYYGKIFFTVHENMGSSCEKRYISVFRLARCFRHLPESLLRQLKELLKHLKIQPKRFLLNLN